MKALINTGLPAIVAATFGIRPKFCCRPCSAGLRLFRRGLDRVNLEFAGLKVV